MERLQVRYFVTGSVATITYGDPRFTNDIDIVLGVLKVRAEKIDREYIATWSERMQMIDIWKEILGRLDNL